MTAYELADYTNALLDTFLTTFTMYMSIVTAYVVTAFVAGERLTRFQLALVNLLFLMATGMVGLLAILVFRRFYEHAMITTTPISEGLDTPVDFTLPILAICVAMVLGSLMFMWSVRRGKPA